MFHNYGKALLSAALLVQGSAIVSFAQNSNKENAPYSRYGLGEQRNGVNTLLKGMGSISSAYANSFAVNTDNPASYSHLLLTTYEVGGEGSSRSIGKGTERYRTGMATLSHLNIGIPISKHVGVAFGLRPNTRTYYRLNDTTSLTGLGKTVLDYSGDGSTNYAFIGGAYATHGLSVGVNFGYLFGTVDNRILAVKQLDTVQAMNSDFVRYAKVGGVYWKTGALYDAKLNKKLSLRIGATATLSQQINVRQDNYQIIWRNSSGTTIADTATSVKGVAGKIQLPLAYSVGAHLFDQAGWLIGVDFSAAQWSQFRQFGNADSLGDSYKMALGGEYTPNSSGVNVSYLSRVTYRAGFYYGRDKVLLQGTRLDYMAFSLGASLPFRRSFDRLHVSTEIGRRGRDTKGLFKENFYKISVGISLNDRWFVKRRYD